MAQSPSKGKPELGPAGKKSTSAAAKKAAAALSAVAPVKKATGKKSAVKKKAAKNPKATAAKPTPKTRKKPGPKLGLKRGTLTATGKPRKKPGPKPGVKRGPLTAAGKPRKKPGPKPTAKKAKTISKTVIAKAASTPKKKTAARKTVAKAKVTAPKTKTTQTKKRAATKVAPKPVTAKKQTQKTHAAKPVSPKRAGPQKTTAKRSAGAKKVAKQTTKSSNGQQLADLRARVDNIDKRLQDADAQAKESIQALGATFAVLDSKFGKSVDSSQLNAEVEKLSAKIASISRAANKDVSATLSHALGDPSAEKLSLALERAENRLSAATAQQSEALTKINRHIADMATAIDKRFRREASLRNAAVSDLRQDALSRIKSVETQSAEAINRLGEKVIAFSSDQGRRAQDSEDVIKEKIAEVALRTQQEFEQYRSKLERRLLTLENEQREKTLATDQAINSLSTRVEGVEFAAVEASQSITPQSASSSVPQPMPIEPAAHAPIDFDDDAFAPDKTISMSAKSVPPNPYAVPEPIPVADPAISHIPSQFKPSPNDRDPFDMGAQIPVPKPLGQTPQAAASAMPLGALETSIPEPMPLEPEMPAPYADPAYAEQQINLEGSMDQARPGSFAIDKSRFSMPQIPQLTPRNIKVAGIAAAVGVVGIFGISKLTNNSGPDAPPTQSSASNTAVSEASHNSSFGGIQPSPMPSVASTNILETAPTIGEYEDNQVDVAPAGSEEALTLEAAADTGNPVAQFQLGVSHLENGRTEEAVRLIRASADKGQPAAQYRLAKLYETGEGVTMNAEMARQLTERAARSGNRIAMHDLALYHAEGRGGLKTDLKAAAKWFEKAADRGVVDSQFNLGVMFETGKGVPKNINDAYVWYGIASAQGDQFARQRLDILKDALSPTDKSLIDARIASFSPSKIDQAANGIFKDVPWGMQKKAEPEQDTRVKQVQVMLMDLGFDTGGADGSIGPKTRAAILKFEAANGLPETGQVSDNLVDRLQFASGA